MNQEKLKRTAPRSVALDYIGEVGLEAIEAREHTLMDRFYRAVSAMEGVTVYGDFSQPRRSAKRIGPVTVRQSRIPIPFEGVLQFFSPLFLSGKRRSLF